MEIYIVDFLSIWSLNRLLKLKDFVDPSSNMATFINILEQEEYSQKIVNTDMENYGDLMNLCIGLYNDNKEWCKGAWTKFLEDTKESFEQDTFYISACEMVKILYLTLEDIKDKSVIRCFYCDEDSIAFLLKNKN